MGILFGGKEKGWCDIDPLTNSFFFLGVISSAGENRPRNATVRVPTDRHTARYTEKLTDANRFHNLSHAICYSYETDSWFRFDTIALYVGI